MPTSGTTLAPLALAAAILAAPVCALADLAPPAPAPAPAPAERPVPPGFERVAGAPDTEKVDASKLVVAAYAAFFVGMFGYVLWVGRQQSAIARELVELGARVRRDGGA